MTTSYHLPSSPAFLSSPHLSSFFFIPSSQKTNYFHPFPSSPFLFPPLSLCSLPSPCRLICCASLSVFLYPFAVLIHPRVLLFNTLLQLIPLYVVFSLLPFFLGLSYFPVFSSFYRLFLPILRPFHFSLFFFIPVFSSFLFGTSLI